MQSEKKIRNDIPYKKERLVRVIVQFRNGSTSAGTGFFINSSGELLTCFHVISAMELRNFRIQKSQNINSPTLTNVSSSSLSEHDKIKNSLETSIMRIEVELHDGVRKIATLTKFNETYDVCLLKIEQTDSGNNFPFFELDTSYMPEYDESTFFCGFQMTGGYNDPTMYPFSTNRAVVSAFPNIEVAGDKYNHIQLNSINLGGNSGAPLFTEGSNTVIGIINGNMSWGRGDLAVVNNISVINTDSTQNTAPETVQSLSQGLLRVPLSIAYSTPIKLISEQTNIL
ncbi:MAG: serine protease [bacterium]